MLDQSNVTVRLTVVNPVDEGDAFSEPQEFMLEHSPEMFIGRAPGNSVVLNNVAVSGTHVRLIRQGNEFILQDLGSRNGTYLNEQRMEPNEQKFLRDGDRIRIVNYVIQFHCGVSAYQPQSSENTRQIALDMIKNVLGGASGHEETPPKMMVMSGVQQGMVVELKDVYTEVKIGRSPHCQMHVNDENISREHAMVRRDWTGVVIRDLNSRNGVVVNGQRIGRNEERKLRDRDEILLGTVKLSFSDPEGARLDNELGDVVGDGVLEQQAKPREPISKPSSPPPAVEEPVAAPPMEEPAPSDFAPPEPEAPAPGLSSPPMADFGAVSEGEEELEGAEGLDLAEAPEGLTGGQKALIGIVVGIIVILVVLVAVLLFSG